MRVSRIFGSGRRARAFRRLAPADFGSLLRRAVSSKQIERSRVFAVSQRLDGALFDALIGIVGDQTLDHFEAVMAALGRQQRDGALADG